MRLPLNLGLAALALILLVVNMDESLANRAAAVEAMRAEVEKSNADARQVAALRQTLADSISGANFLSEKKRKNPLTVALIDDLTRRLPEDTYLERLQVENGEVQLQGQAKEAAKLIALLGASECLANSKLQGQIQPDPRTNKERFQITADVKPCSGASGEGAAAPAGAKASNADKNAEAPAKSEAPKEAAAKEPDGKGEPAGTPAKPATEKPRGGEKSAPMARPQPPAPKKPLPAPAPRAGQKEPAPAKDRGAANATQ